MNKINIELLKMRLHIEKDEKRRKEIEDILEKDDEELADLYLKKHYKTIKEKQWIIANALKIKIDDVIYDRAEKFISGNRNKFEIYNKAIEYFDFYSLNEYEIHFYDCDVNFVISKGPSVYAEDINFKSLYFFNCRINISIYDNFCCENMYFKNCKINFLKCNKVIVNGNIKFSNSNFINKSIFNSCIFKDNIYFNNSHFKDYADFCACEFEKTACFYGVEFDKAPNFSACYFKEQKAVNLINVNIDQLDFRSAEDYIKDNYQDKSYKNETKGMQNEKEKIKIQNEYKLRCAKNLKDSFRVLKDVLITQNNTLEAQEWHKLELYAKEKENHINLSVKDREKDTDIFKNILIWFNCVLLNVYRNTSDHHNDFLKNLNFTVGMIVLYGVFIFFCQACIEPYSKFFNELKSSVIFIIIGILVFLCCIMFYFNRKKSIFAKSIFFIIAMVFIVLYLVTYFYKTNEYKTILYLVMCYILSIYICYFFFNIKNIIFNIVFKFMLYLVFLFFLINSSQLINPFAGVFSSGKLYESQFEKSLNDLNASAIINLAKISFKEFNLNQEYKNISFTELNSAKALIVANKENLLKLNDANLNRAKEVLGEKYTELLKTINQDKITENTIKSTSVLYSIILLLCIFSLQKTARKNSIVPS
ncbi:hypothetical protein ACXHET_001808 [Campylobacter coli]